MSKNKKNTNKETNYRGINYYFWAVEDEKLNKLPEKPFPTFERGRIWS